MYEKQLLKELEALKNDVNNANLKTVAQPNSIPRPSIIPPLEDDMRSSIRPVTSAPPMPRPASSFPAFASTSALPSLKQQPSSPPSVPGPSTSRRPPVSPPPPSSASPLGGRFRDGTQSMIVQPSVTPAGPLFTGTPSPSLSQDPLLGKSTPTSASPAHPLSGASSSTKLDPSHRPSTPQFDPLANLTAATMSQSMRVQPSRPRLDAKIAASKLANMF